MGGRAGRPGQDEIGGASVSKRINTDINWKLTLIRLKIGRARCNGFSYWSHMNIAEIELELKELVDSPFDPESFIYRLLEIYDAPKATVTKLRTGLGNQAKAIGDVLLKNKIFFRVAKQGQAAQAVDAMATDPLTKRHKPRLLFSTDGWEVYCRDTKADQSIDLELGRLNDSFDFLLPLAGIERYEGVAENPADIKATGRLAKLYDAILEANPDWIERNHTHELNLFMTRLLFCFFAENTSIFEKRLFSSTVFSLIEDSGANALRVLQTVFRAMDTPPASRRADSRIGLGMPRTIPRFCSLRFTRCGHTKQST